MFLSKKFGQKIYRKGDYFTIFQLFKEIKKINEYTTEEHDFSIEYLAKNEIIIILKEIKINTIKFKKHLNQILQQYDIHQVYILKEDSIKTLFLKSFNINEKNIFTFSEILLKAINHATQPLKIDILDEAEIQQVLIMYNIEKENLPKLSNSDILVKYCNIKSQDVVKILRSDGTYYYRLCI